MNLIPETKVLQFGTGKLLRGLFDPLINVPSGVTVLQSRDEATTRDWINKASTGYHLWVRGFQQGAVVEEVHEIRSLGKALSLTHHWSDVQNQVADPTYRLVVSNTTEKGLALDPADISIASLPDTQHAPPASFPARLLALLWHRYQTCGEGLVIMPLELIEENAEVLKRLVFELSDKWKADTSFLDWLRNDCRWLSTLVDRICVDVVPPVPWSENDPLAVMTEPFQMLVVQKDGGPETILPSHPAIIWADDLKPFFLQKVRLLNGLHTAMVARCLPQGFQYVIDVMNDPDQADWVHNLLFNELVPTLEKQGLQVQAFAGQVLDRFRNPFFQHRLADIAVGHETKRGVRLQPTHEEYQRLFGKVPPLLTETLELPLP